MPHKRNPITSEQISGLARVVRANAQVAFEDIALWHERDISHSSAERVILPDSTILADYLLAKTDQLIANLLVYPERMLRNLESTGGLVFSGQLLLDLAAAGMSREDAYRLVQSHAMRSWKEGLTFRDEIARDPAITSRLTPAQLAARLRLPPASSPTSTPSSPASSAASHRSCRVPHPNGSFIAVRVGVIAQIRHTRRCYALSRSRPPLSLVHLRVVQEFQPL